MENPKFTMFKGGIQYYWNLKAKNGEKILSSEAYTTKQGCQTGIASVKINASYDERYDRKVSVNSQYYFNLKASNGEILGRSEMYASKEGRESGIAAVKKDAPSAPIEDLT
jgi:uncharacterized protein